MQASLKEEQRKTRLHHRVTCAEDILLKILKLCLQNDAEGKININLDKMRSIVKVIEEGILVNI